MRTEWRYGDGWVRRIPFDFCREWIDDGDCIRHVTGRYFSLVVIEDEHGHEHLMIDQPEIGLLAFACCRSLKIDQQNGDLRIEN